MRKEIYPDAQDYPYGGDDEDYCKGGYTAEVATRLAQQNKWAIYIMHGENKIFAWRPDSGEHKNVHVPIICFGIHDHHAFFYDRTKGSGSAIQSISQMHVVNELPCPTQCKIVICGEEEREHIAPFEEWKELPLQELYGHAETRVGGDTQT